MNFGIGVVSGQWDEELGRVEPSHGMCEPVPRAGTVDTLPTLHSPQGRAFEDDQ